MCLTINQTAHGQHMSYYIATRDILVWKSLNKYANQYGKRYKSPFRNHPYLMGKMETVARLYSVWWKVHDGLHAYQSNLYNSNDIYPAIIPKGSKIFFGSCNDVVSDNLIVFENMEKLQTSYKVDMIPKSYKELTKSA